MILTSEEKASEVFTLAFLQKKGEFRKHIERVSTQFQAQRTLKESLKNHVANH